MTHKFFKGKLALVGFLAGAFLIGGDIISEIEFSNPFVFEIGKSFVFVNEAEARVGRPLTPASVRGVARRTTRRRVIRRTTIYVATLPTSCSRVTINSTLLHHCGDTYYQSSGDTYVVVNVE
ncbi:MAG: hypothetical protein V3R64_07680 [Sphingomonadales bacterium]